MQDNTHIDNIIEKLKFIWKNNSNLRLGQLITSVLGFSAMYYAEDDELINILSNFYKVDVSKIISTIDNNKGKAQISLASNMKSIGEANKGRIYIHNDSEIKSIKKSELNVYLAKGYKLGRK